MQALLLSVQDVGKTKQIQKLCLTIPFNIVFYIFVSIMKELKPLRSNELLFYFFSMSHWYGWHLWARNVFFSICFPKFHLPFCSSLFALCTSVTISGLAGSTLNSSAGTSASHCHLCPGLPNPFSLSTHLLSPFFRCCSRACMFISKRMNMHSTAVACKS